MAFSKWRNITRRASAIIQSRPHSSTKSFRQIPGISVSDKVAGRRECWNGSLASSSAINVQDTVKDKTKKKKYTSYELIESLYHLTEDTMPFKIPIIQPANSHFCAGETLGDVIYELQRMEKLKLKGIIHYTVEDAANNATCDANLNHFLGIVSSQWLFPPRSATFMSLKLSAICTPELLERVSHLLRWHHCHPDMNLPWKEEVLPILVPASPDHHTTTEPEPLSPTEENYLNLAEQRLFQLCRACEAASLPLLVDAEYAAIQPAIDYLVYRAFSKFNRSPGKPVVYVTVQAYLKDSFPRIIAASQEDKKRGIKMGVNLVRGAYMKVEDKHDTYNADITSKHEDHVNASEHKDDEDYEYNTTKIYKHHDHEYNFSKFTSSSEDDKHTQSSEDEDDTAEDYKYTYEYNTSHNEDDTAEDDKSTYEYNTLPSKSDTSEEDNTYQQEDYNSEEHSSSSENEEDTSEEDNTSQDEDYNSEEHSSSSENEEDTSEEDNTSQEEDYNSEEHSSSSENEEDNSEEDNTSQEEDYNSEEHSSSSENEEDTSEEDNTSQEEDYNSEEHSSSSENEEDTSEEDNTSQEEDYNSEEHSSSSENEEDISEEDNTT